MYICGPQLRQLFQKSFIPIYAARTPPLYENQRYRSLKYKSMAKASRKAKRASMLGGLPSPKDTGEEIPPFFLQPRYKLLFRVLQDQKNCGRVARKPMPQDLKLKFAQTSKEYHAFKTVEKQHIEQELNEQLKVQMKAMDAIVFLPDYLLEECLSENGETQQEDMYEFRPAMLYMEQMLRLYPREISCRWKLLPAFEESLMRIEEARSAEEQK